ncbi:gp16 family protein [Chachezhania sediminis]|uniref:gp16 family protein n=1 Tax=Chachezhania sediminis TaxID=2599291 RepID=UPI00131D6423|nr:regulatory protein GemA [Chachezhania sediminis]
MTDRALQRQIHVACRELGLDADTRHDLQLAVTGKASMSDMSDADLHLVMSALKDRGFKPAGKGAFKGRSEPLAPRADLRFVHVLWKQLGDAGALTRPDRDGLNAFIRSRFEGKWQFVPLDVDALRDPVQINAVIQALKDMCRREGIDLE